MAKDFGVFFLGLKLCCLLIVVDFTFALPRGLFSTEEDDALISYPPAPFNLLPHEDENIPKNCYHFFVSQNMSSLLTDATKMLRQVRNQREREWILTFIHRIKSLAEHIRSHPDSRNYDCLTDLESRKKMLNVRVQQPELYFVDEDPHNQKRSPPQKQKKVLEDASSGSPDGVAQESQSSNDAERDNQDLQQLSTQQQSQSIPPLNDVEAHKSTPSTDEMIHPADKQRASENLIFSEIKQSQPNKPPGKENFAQNSYKPTYHTDYSNAIVLSSDPNCEPKVGCPDVRTSMATESGIFGDDDLLAQQIYAGNSLEDDQREQEALKKRIKKALLEELAPEVKKLRTVDGSLDDLVNLWKMSEDKADKTSEANHDFDYEETGAAAGDLNSADKTSDSDPSVPPSIGQLRNSKREVESKGNSAYDDNDVLVQQLFDVRFNEPPPKTTKSLNDQSEYLITSTILPY